MVKNEKNEELQSRREFFKKAAKGALPILGAVVLASAPGLANAAELVRIQRYVYSPSQRSSTPSIRFCL